MKCLSCNGKCIKKGKTKFDIQKYQCLNCKKYQREEYKRKGYRGDTEARVKELIRESSGIRSISRVLKISTTTVNVVLKRIASKIQKPKVKFNKVYEVDELKTHVQKKKNEQWIIYAIDKKTRQVVDFKVGKRNKGNIKTVVETLLLGKAKLIYTDGLNIYPPLIPKQQHKVVPHNTNYIERKNLNLRTHLKCLTRRSICFCKSISMLSCIMKIYFWG